MLESTKRHPNQLSPRQRLDPEPSTWSGRPSVRRWGIVVGCGALLNLAASHEPTPDTSLLRSHPRQTLAGTERVTGADTVTTVADLRTAAVKAFASAFAYFAWDGGILTDELRAPLNGLTVNDLSTVPLNWPATPPGWWNFTSKDIWRRLTLKDVRRIPERMDPRDTTPDVDGENAINQYIEHIREAELDEGYLRMQGARAYLSVALGALATTPPASADAAGLAVDRSELYALSGYADVQLADLFCSGVPLNTVAGMPVARMRSLRNQDTEKAYYLQTLGNRNQALAYKEALANHQVGYHASSTTQQVYRAALAQFDTALRLVQSVPATAHSTEILNLARVGRGQVWVAIGQYDSASAAVAQVPEGFQYRVRTWMNLDPDGDEEAATVSDREGKNGLPYLSSKDPRTATQEITGDKLIKQVRIPAKWRELDGEGMGQVTFPLVSGVEAVLIRAEAALHKNATDGTWLRLLNHLRATVPIPGTTQPDSAQLSPLRDPGTAHGRIALLFAERAYWLFLTGHRQGDLRRLVREYHWPQEQVYPTGPYVVPQGFLGQVGQYGSDVNLPIPPEELANPKFHGCLNRGA